MPPDDEVKSKGGVGLTCLMRWYPLGRRGGEIRVKKKPPLGGGMRREE